MPVTSWTDPTLVEYVTPIKTTHVNQLRTAMNTVETLMDDVISYAMGGTVVLDGCNVVPDSPADMGVTVSAGHILMGGTKYTVAETAVTGFVAPTNYRIDLVYITTSQVISTVTGTNFTTTPVFPDVPTDCLGLAYIYLTDATTSLDATNVYDIRKLSEAKFYTPSINKGTANALVFDLGLSTIAPGTTVVYLQAVDNTGAMTVSVNNGTTTKNLIKSGVEGGALVAGDIPGTSMVFLVYDGTNWEYVVAASASSGTGGGGGNNYLTLMHTAQGQNTTQASWQVLMEGYIFADSTRFDPENVKLSIAQICTGTTPSGQCKVEIYDGTTTITTTFDAYTEVTEGRDTAVADCSTLSDINDGNYIWKVTVYGQITTGTTYAVNRFLVKAPPVDDFVEDTLVSIHPDAVINSSTYVGVMTAGFSQSHYMDIMCSVRTLVQVDLGTATACDVKIELTDAYEETMEIGTLSFVADGIQQVQIPMPIIGRGVNMRATAKTTGGTATIQHIECWLMQ